MVAYVFVLLGVVRERVALTVVFLDILLYSVGGVIGTMHHLYFSGEPASTWRSAPSSPPPEVILPFLTVEAWSFHSSAPARRTAPRLRSPTAGR